MIKEGQLIHLHHNRLQIIPYKSDDNNNNGRRQVGGHVELDSNIMYSVDRKQTQRMIHCSSSPTTRRKHDNQLNNDRYSPLSF